MKIQIDTERKIINVIGIVKLYDLIEYLNKINIDSQQYSIGEAIHQDPVISSSPMMTVKPSYYDPPYIITC